MIIECEKCVLRKWQHSDLPNLVKYANNPKIANNMRDSFPNPYTMKKGEEWLKLSKRSNTTHNFAITINNEAVGGVGLEVGRDIERISAEAGYWIAEEYWGQGITAYALKGLLGYGFNNLKLERIFSTPFDHNIASRKVLEKNGFFLEGIMRNSVIKSGKIYNKALYSIIREDYLKY
ncbi:MAG: GNAT family N-acetyltransferase [Methanobacteriales archaeon HGW-Methanobacteriales-1]|jgi:RimJ/RimL family protein N-acetyltransferase|nr:MAG: GNAT family N-acetyltransferase [Methanobacteriales archaeon HGW-Methanobacteriales-1]